MKLFFNYPNYHSVTNMLFELELPSFDTLIWNSKARFKRQVKKKLLQWFYFSAEFGFMM